MILLALMLGVIDPSCTKEKICQPDYTATVRPSASYTNRLKREQMQERGLTGEPSSYEEDHAISLELGGHPTDSNNLWPEPWAEARKKDRLETYLHRQVCAGKMALGEAQKEIWPNWKAYYKQYFGVEP